MQKLKVKILKKSKNAPYPEHIIVESPVTHEMVHLYFDNGDLTRLTHIVRDSQIKMLWNAKEKRYEPTLSHYTIDQDILYRKDHRDHCVMRNRLTIRKNPTFINVFNSSKWNTSAIGFKAHPKSPFRFFIDLDLNGRCTPYAYIRDYDVADIKTIYPHQERKVPASSAMILKGNTLSK